MKHARLGIFGAMLLCMVSFAACCKENTAKSKACAATTSSEDCKKCCGGNYSYTGDGSCSCY